MKTLLISLLLLLGTISINAQDSLYIYKDGLIIDKHSISNIDSIIFYRENTELLDIDGNQYKTIKLGSQVWMAENLKTTNYNDGAPILNITDNTQWANSTIGAYSWFNNDKVTNGYLGAFYNWYVIETSKICPKGWRVPSRDDWTTLSDFLITNGFGYEGTGSDIAKSLASKTSWQISSLTGTIGADMNTNNTSGFNALSTGYRYDTFYYLGKWASWWSSSISTEPGAAWYFFLEYNSSNFTESYIGYYKGGKSIRCIKD